MSQCDWDVRYLQLAAHISTWSKDHRQVGAVLVRDNRVISMGFNGLPTGVEDKYARLSDTPTKLAMVVHAEENALLVAGERACGATLYVYGLPVCSRCASSIIQAKVRNVVAGAPKQRGNSIADLANRLNRLPGETDWQAMGELAIMMLREGNVDWLEATLNESQAHFLKSLPEPKMERRSGRERRIGLSLAAE